jgi:non-ribosomal peptide synthetase component F
MFVGQLAMRNRPGGDKTFREFLREVKENALKAYENQDYQFDVLVSRLGLHGNYSRHPLFDVVFAIQDWEITEPDIPGLKLKQYEYEEETSKTDLRVGAEEMNGIINMRITYATALFKRSTIEKMAERYIDILNQVLENVDVKLADIRITHKLAMAKSNILQEEKSVFGF